MQFHSFQFFIFFAAVVAVYYSLTHKYRWIFLLIGSYYFYMCWKPEYIFLILTSTLIDYFAGLKMAAETVQAKRKKFLILSLCTNLGLLFAFKYFNFFNDSARELFNYFNVFYNAPSFGVLLPVGISFYTFQTLSYTIDVYRGIKKPEKHLGIFALYVSFFPQLVAGPIERSTRLLPQFYDQHRFCMEKVVEGLKLIAWGLFKKIVIADRLAIIVDKVYASPTEFSGLSLIVATYCFAFQIYCDFSGYSDIAIGSARILGFDLMANFKRPYLARNIRDFWSRWHISLTTWFKDYLYIPLGGNCVSTNRWVINVMIVFLISGLWHGASWTFIIWGALHGVYFISSRLITNLREQLKIKLLLPEKVRTLLQIFFTFNLVSLGWIFFRANSLTDARYILKNIFDFTIVQNIFSVVPGFQIAILIACLFIAFFKMYMDKRASEFSSNLFYALILNFIIFFAVESHQGFIYFQF